MFSIIVESSRREECTLQNGPWLRATPCLLRSEVLQVRWHAVRRESLHHRWRTVTLIRSLINWLVQKWRRERRFYVHHHKSNLSPPIVVKLCLSVLSFSFQISIPVPVYLWMSLYFVSQCVQYFNLMSLILSVHSCTIVINVLYCYTHRLWKLAIQISNFKTIW